MEMPEIGSHNFSRIKKKPNLMLVISVQKNDREAVWHILM